MKMKRRQVTNLRITKDKNVQGRQPHWGDQELAAGVYHKSFSYSRARGDLTTVSSVDDSPLYDSPFDDSPIDNRPIEDSPLDDCSTIVHQCDKIFLPLYDSSLDESLLDNSPLAIGRRGGVVHLHVHRGLEPRDRRCARLAKCCLCCRILRCYTHLFSGAIITSTII